MTLGATDYFEQVSETLLVAGGDWKGGPVRMSEVTESSQRDLKRQETQGITVNFL